MSDDRPSDTEPPCDVREMFAHHVTGKVISIGSFSPGWDEERRNRTAQQQLRHDLANCFRSNEAAGKYDEGEKK